MGNTMLLSGFTDKHVQGNAFQMIFPSFVRVGCSSGCQLNASWILGQMDAVIGNMMGANGYLSQAGGGIETAGGAVAVNDMLLMSFESFFALFPGLGPVTRRQLHNSASSGG